MKKSLVIATLFTNTLLFGQTWSTIPSGTNEFLRAVHFPSSNVGYAVGQNGTILKSTNGGNAWQSLSNAYPGFWFWDVHFVDENVGFIGGESDPGNNPSGAAIVLKTIDGGTTWSTVYSNSSHPIRDIFVLNSTVIYAAGGAENAFGADSRIVKSSDSGVSWAQVGPSIIGTNNAGAIIGGMHFFDENNGVMGEYDFLDQSYWVTTNNGCASLTMTAIPSSVSYWNFATDFSGPSTGYMTRSTYAGNPAWLRKTTDAGATWSESMISGATNIYDVDFIDVSLGFIVGDAGAIMKSTDGGASWSNESSGSTDNLRSVCFLTNSLGFAVGENGTILKYSNAASAVLNLSCGATLTITASQQGTTMPDVTTTATYNTTCP